MKIPVNKPQWHPLEMRLIEEIRKHPKLYLPHKSLGKTRYLKNIYPIWKEFSKKTGTASVQCQNLWSKMRSRYAILQYVLEKGEVSEKIAKTAFGVGKYLTGCLDFLKPHVDQILITADLDKHRDFVDLIRNLKPTVRITPESLQKLIHNEKDTIPEIDNSDMDYLMRTVERAVLESLDDINLTKMKTEHEEIETEKTITSDEDSRTDSHTINVEKTKDVGKPTELDKMGAPKICDVPAIKSTAKIRRKRPLTYVKHKPPKLSNPELPNTFFLKYEEQNAPADIKQYMIDLSEVLCQKLRYEKRKIFLDKVDMLVSQVLEWQLDQLKVKAQVIN